MKILYMLLFPLMFTCCNRVEKAKSGEILNIHKSKFDNYLIDHFPSDLGFCNEYKIVSDENILKNNVGLLVYCYGVDSEYLDSINVYYQDQSIAKYENSDSCLLVVNQFESLDSFNKGDKVYLDYNTRIKQDKKCFYDRFPIPKFMSYKNVNLNTNTYLPNDFIYYVLEAKTQASSKYDLIPNPQMPDIWANGFSKGVAINKKNKEIIFWGIIW